MEIRRVVTGRTPLNEAFVVCIALVVLAGCGSPTPHPPSGNASTSGNASSDATIAQCSVQFDYVAASGTVKNTSSQPASFAITVAYVAPDGTQLETGTTDTLVVARGQTGSWETSSVPTRYVAGATCKLSSVTRMASAP